MTENAYIATARRVLALETGAMALMATQLDDKFVQAGLLKDAA